MGGKKSQKKSLFSFFSIFRFKKTRQSGDEYWDDSVKAYKVYPSDQDSAGRWADPRIDKKASDYIHDRTNKWNSVEFSMMDGFGYKSDNEDINFHGWSRNVRMALGAKLKLGFIDGSCIKPDVGYTELQSELWKEIAERYGQSNGLLVYQLEREFSKITQDERMYLDVLEKFMLRDSNLKLIQFLMKLNNEYESVRSQILAMDPLPTVNKAYYIVQQIEKQKQVTTDTFEPSAFFDNMNNKGSNNRRKENKGSRIDGEKAKKQRRMAVNVTAGFDDHFNRDTRFDLNTENELGMIQGGGFDQKLVAAVCQETNLKTEESNVFLLVIPLIKKVISCIIGRYKSQQTCPIYLVFDTHPLEETVIPNIPLLENTPTDHPDNNESTMEHVEEPITRALIPSQTSVPVKKSTRSSTRPAWLQDFVTPAKVNSVITMPTYPLFSSFDFQNISFSHVAFLANVFAVPQPTSYKQAIQHKGWVKAMEAELAALERNETWTVTELPPGHKPITFKWVYKIEYKPTNVVDRLKARLVVKGFNQKEGLDYTPTFYPVAKLATVRVLIALATAKQWPLRQLDINNAFLHGNINEEIYMVPPEGYTKASGGQVCKLSKSLYGLKHASRQWNHELKKFLVSLGYVQSKHDYSLFVKAQGKTFTTVLVYVDDMLLTGNSQSKILNHKNCLDKKFTINDIGLAKYFLGIELYKTDTRMHLNQMKYIFDLLTYAGLTGAKPSPFPLLTQLKLSFDKGTPLKDAGVFKRLIGRLLYLTMTRPDISYADQHLSQFVSAPKDAHMQAALHLLRYLKGTISKDVMTKALGELQHTSLVDKLGLTEAPT
nr:hypothetical protein [Tanacetum cinerariifolium]